VPALTHWSVWRGVNINGVKQAAFQIVSVHGNHMAIAEAVAKNAIVESTEWVR